MKCVIFCGGRGSRMSGDTPKPLLQIGGMPIVEHIMHHYTACGIKDFILLTGYKHDQFENHFQDWRNVVCFDTGLETMTALRLWKAKELLQEEENFCLTYGDAVSNVDFWDLIRCHKPLVTITGIHPQSQYGVLLIDHNNMVHGFEEKPVLKEWINAGYMIVQKGIWDIMDNDNIPFEQVLNRLTEMHKLHFYPFTGFWKSMDTPKDLEELQQIWDKNQLWKVWT